MTAGLRVGLVIADTTGGISRHVQSIATDMAAREVEVEIIGPGSSLDAICCDPVADLKLTALPVGAVSPAALIDATRGLRSVGRRLDILHAHGVRAGAMGSVLPGRVPLVVTWHNAPQAGLRAGAGFQVAARRAARPADLTLTVSGDLAERAKRLGAKNVQRVFIPADVRTPIRTPVAVRSEFGIGDSRLILAAGRLHRQKRFDLVIRALAGWPDGHTPPVLLVAGDGPDRGGLERLAAQLSINARFLGSRNDIPDLIAAADVCAMPSDWEGCPLLAQEVLTAGTPLVATAVGGVPDLVGSAADLVPPDDVDALRTALVRVLDHPDRNAELRRIGPERAATWPSPAEEMDKLHAIYLNLTSSLR